MRHQQQRGGRFRRENNNDNNSNSNSSNNNNNGRTATIQHYKSPLPPTILHRCLQLFVTNMAKLYKDSSWGFNVDEKRKELEHEGARFLVVLQTSGENDKDGENGENDNPDKASNNRKVLGFAHYRYEPSDDDEDDSPSTRTYLPITHLYELQISPSCQSLGLGKQLMTLAELLSYKAGMKKCMLTVFHANVGKMKFYQKRMRYGMDECSPCNFVGKEDCDYEILSKEFP